MTSPTTDQYQRALDLLDDDNFWDRYLIELQDDQARDSDRTEEEQPTADVDALAEQHDGEPNVTVLSTAYQRGKPSARSLRSGRTTMFQRAALAAAAGISIVAGFALLNPDRERPPVEVSIETNPTATVEAPLVVAVSPPTAPDPTVTPDPIPTPILEPTPEPNSAEVITTPEPITEPTPTPEPAEAPPTSADSSGEGAANPSEATPPPDDETPSTPEPPAWLDPTSFEYRTFEYINRIRRGQQLPELRLDPSLTVIAQEQVWAFTDHQDTTLQRHPDFDPESDFQTQQMLNEAWTVAAVLGTIDVGTRLPAGWTGWDYHAGRGSLMTVADTEAANALHVGEFTHVGLASASGNGSATTGVIIFANYPLDAPALAAGTVPVRTDQHCSSASDRDLYDSVISVASQFTFEARVPAGASTVEIQLCEGAVRKTFPEHELESRYRVSVEQPSSGRVFGRFTCFVWEPCLAVVELDGNSSVNLVFTKLSPEDVTIIIPSGSMTYSNEDGEATLIQELGFLDLTPDE